MHSFAFKLYYLSEITRVSSTGLATKTRFACVFRYLRFFVLIGRDNVHTSRESKWPTLRTESKYPESMSETMKQFKIPLQ